MMNLEYERIDEIKFYALNIRNKGTINMNNGEHQHQLTGTLMQIYPGGLFTAKNLRVDVDSLIIDVIAEMNADNNGYCNMGMSHGHTFAMLSHRGQSDKTVLNLIQLYSSFYLEKENLRTDPL